MNYQKYNIYCKDNELSEEQLYFKFKQNWNSDKVIFVEGPTKFNFVVWLLERVQNWTPDNELQKLYGFI